MENKIVCVDLDGIILEDFDGEFEQDNFGNVKKNARMGLFQLRKMGYDIVVWTTRGNTEEVIDYLEEEEVPFDYVNYHPLPDMKNAISRKIYADLYIDDRALGCPNDWNEIIDLLKNSFEEVSKEE